MAQRKQVVRIKSAPDILGLIPYLIGFQPESSFVGLGLRRFGDKLRVGLTVRSELPGKPSVRPYAEHVTVRLAHHGHKSVVYVVYADEGDLDYPPTHLFEALIKQAALHGMEVHDALLVANRRWRSHLCTNAQCCPADGTPLDESPSPAVLSAVAAGMSTLPSRQAMEELLKPASEITLAVMEQETTRAAAAALAARNRGGRSRYGSETVALVKQLVERQSEMPPVPPTHAEAARVLVGLVDLEVRDRCMCWARGRHGEAARTLWSEIVRLSVPPLGAAPATILAYVAWQQGDGSFANVALERAFAHDPDYSLAHLLAEALQRSIHPRTFSPVRLRALLGADEFSG